MRDVAVVVHWLKHFAVAFDNEESIDRTSICMCVFSSIFYIKLIKVAVRR